MISRDTYNASIASAEATARATIATAAITFQEAVNAVGDNVGANPQLGATATTIGKIATAQAAYVASCNAANATANATKDAAKATLRATGDVAAL
jgi:hypothetical protein